MVWKSQDARIGETSAHHHCRFKTAGWRWAPPCAGAQKSASSSCAAVRRSNGTFGAILLVLALNRLPRSLPLLITPCSQG